MVTFISPRGIRVLVDPGNVRMVLGHERAQVYLRTGIDIPVRESREAALERVTAPKRRKAASTR